MAVFTAVDSQQLEKYLRDYDIGSPVDFAGIQSGIENSNYFLTTSAGEFVLTLFEATPPDELPFYMDLLAFLAARGLPVATPVARRDSSYLGELSKKPSVIVSRLAGQSEVRPTSDHCAQVATVLAQLHAVAQAFSLARHDDRGAIWRTKTATKIRPLLNGTQNESLDRELQAYEQWNKLALPGGVIHADLFRDNVLFANGTLSGLIDFYYAHTGAFIYDLAISVIDWSFVADGAFSAENAKTMVSHYQAQRALEPEERSAWSLALRSAALRFWLSRTHDKFFPRAARYAETKDPEPFMRLTDTLVDGSSALLKLV
ncbi:MAG: homoserine kinase [Pseudomonadota bacterium]